MSHWFSIHFNGYAIFLFPILCLSVHTQQNDTRTCFNEIRMPKAFKFRLSRDHHIPNLPQFFLLFLKEPEITIKDNADSHGICVNANILVYIVGH